MENSPEIHMTVIPPAIHKKLGKICVSKTNLSIHTNKLNEIVVVFNNNIIIFSSFDRSISFINAIVILSRCKSV